MEFLPVFKKMLELFLIIIIAYLATKKKIINKEAKANLSKIILNITMPCTILSSVMNSDNIPQFKQLLMLLFVSFTSYIILFIIAKLTSFVLKLKGDIKGVVEFGIMFANVGFIGFPVTQAIFGEDCLLYTTMFNMPFNLLCYSLGASMIKNGSSISRSKSIKEIISSIFNPAMIAAIIALIMAFTKCKGPDFLADTFSLIGAMTTPGALLIIGAALAEMSVKEMFNDLKAYLVTIVTVVITPVIMYLIYKPFCQQDPLLLGEVTIITAMPVATAGTMLCSYYGKEEKLMARITFLSTLASVITIPLIVSKMLCQML